MKTSLFVIAAAIVIILAAGNAAHATREHCTEHQVYDHDNHVCIDKVQDGVQEETKTEPAPVPHIQPTPPTPTPVAQPESVLENWGK